MSTKLENLVIQNNLKEIKLFTQQEDFDFLSCRFFLYTFNDALIDIFLHFLNHEKFCILKVQEEVLNHFYSQPNIKFLMKINEIHKFIINEELKEFLISASYWGNINFVSFFIENDVDNLLEIENSMMLEKMIIQSSRSDELEVTKYLINLKKNINYKYIFNETKKKEFQLSIEHNRSYNIIVKSQIKNKLGEFK
jgi:hypothetical protein